MVVRKRIGRPMLCGWAWCGWSQCGEEIELAGVYQMRISRKGIKTGEPVVGPKRICFMAPTWPIQPASALRDAQQAKFITAFGMWQDLTDEEKAWYREIALKKRRKGFNYFMSITLKSL